MQIDHPLTTPGESHPPAGAGTPRRTWRRRALAMAAGLALALTGSLSLQAASAPPAEAAVTVTVNTNGTGLPLSVRTSASTTAAVKYTLANGARVNIECHVRGSSVNGIAGATTIWNRVSGGGYVSDGFLNTGSNAPVVPACGSGYDTSKFYLPYDRGAAFTVSQDPYGTFSHVGAYNEWAWDFAMPLDTRVRAAKGGRVLVANWSQYAANGIEVLIDHGGNVCTHYAHLNATHLNSGQTVRTGDQVGRVGTTGASTGPHLHYQVIRCDNRVALQSQFAEGFPRTGQRVASQTPAR